MIDEDLILQRAGVLKLALSKRAVRIMGMHHTLGAYDMGQARDLKPGRVETVRASLERASNKQARDGLIYASLRWVLGASDDIDDENLDLDD